ncbi:gamma-mobile-trio protein GmtX [Acinetobacter cumulans]|uniref:gamma-mobile-trio protein GmtX n=1 Tax=Acinetobacter cumulans TaxID=2136182 RepID=UPI001443E833|nr:gamma-mobile-trio protein GmtX [Acinetobacter cumulans]
MLIDIDMILDDLKRDKNPRTQCSLDKLNHLLKRQFEEGKKDFSIGTIGQLSKENGGVGTVSIRNKSGEHFRLLIDAWATKANASVKKIPKDTSKKLKVPADMELLKRLADPAMRAVFGQIIAERNKLKAENSTLKQNTEIIVDMRPNQFLYTPQAEQGVEVLPALDSILLKTEIEALEDAINETKILSRCWTVTQMGGVKDENGHTLFKTGFISAIQKVLAEI